MNARPELDAGELLRTVSLPIPPALRAHVVVIGSIATAWAFRDVSGTHTVATKDIDLLLRPAVDAVAIAQKLGQGRQKAGSRGSRAAWPPVRRILRTTSFPHCV